MLKRVSLAVACAAAVACGLAFAVPAMAQSSASATTYPTRVTGLAISPATATYPAGVSVSGTASYQSGGDWLPWTGATVEVSAVSEFVPCVEANTCTGPGPWYASTNDNGVFTVAIPGPIAPDTYDLQISQPGYADASTSFTVPVDHVGMVSTKVTAALTTSGYVNLYACAQPNTEVGYPKDMAPFPRGRFEYAKSKSGPWKVLTGASSVKGSYGPPTRYNGCYSAKAKAPGQSEYYRLDTPADTAYQSIVSAAIQATKPATSYITNFKVSPTSVKAGSQVKVSGLLHIKTSLYVANPKVRIMFRPDGSSSWKVYKTVNTVIEAGGGTAKSFAAKISLHASGSVAVWFYGTQVILPCKSKSVSVHVSG